MKTTMKTVLMTASVLAFTFTAAPAMADPTVMCSIKSSYTGGVDVHGKPVTPAEAGAPSYPSVRIPLTIDLAQRMNEVLPEGMKLEPQVGTVDIRNDGHVLFNGKDLTGPANALCSTIEKQKESAAKTKDVAKKKKAKKRAADVPADVNAQPVEPVAAEPAPAPAAEPVAAPVPETPPAAEPAPAAMPEAAAPPSVPAPEPAAPAPEPQVLKPAEPVPAPAVEPVPVAPTPPMPTPPQPPAPAEIISPTEGGMVPRPPAPQGNPDEMLSGGGQ